MSVEFTEGLVRTIARIRRKHGPNAAALYEAILTRSQWWWGTVSELADIADISKRRAEQAFVLLEGDGLVEVQRKGSKNQERRLSVRGVAAIEVIAPVRSDRSQRSDQIDRTGTIEVIAPVRSDRSQRSTSTHARGPAPPDPDLKNLIRPSVLEGSGEGHARTGETFTGPDVRGSDVRWICEQWSVSGAVAHQCWQRLLGFGLTRVEGRAYLAAAKLGTHAAFNGLEWAKRPLGATCTRERAEPWIAWYRRGREDASAPAPPTRTRPPLSPDEVEAFAELAKKAMR